MMANGQSRIARRKQKKGTKKPVWKKVLFAILMVVLVIGIGVGSLFSYYIITAPKIDAEKLSDPFSSLIYNMNDEVFAEHGDVKRTKIEYDQLPQVLIDAVTATEDARFFKHSGIDIRRIGGAIKANITNGFGSEGASTITQQVIEDSFLTPDKKIKLKVQEQWLALKLEREYSKEQILEMYLNKIFYGSHSYGVATAAKTYFDKSDLNDLTLVEAAILAGLPQRPTAYNPYKNPDLTKKRVDTVLTLMVRHGKITEEEAEEAREVDIESILSGKRPDTTPFEGFIQEVRIEVQEKLDANIDTDGLKVYTTLDEDVQEHVEFILTDSEDNPISYPDDDMQAGLTVLDTSSGAIRAIGGRRNSTKNDEYNHAIQGGQQPGSTAKPIVSFGPAIEYDKISTYHQINDDKPYEISGSSPIRNWNREYQGWMSARTALSQSLNVPTVKLLEETGYDKAKTFGEGLGIEFSNDPIDPRDAIGGTGTIVNPLELAGAYRAFGNEGIYNEPYAVTKVEFPDGKVVDLKPESEAAMSDYTAYMITDMLKTVMDEGTGTLANIPGLPVAGKTGTTSSDHFDGSPDAWFSGYTTNYTMAIWTGYTGDKRKEQPLPTTEIPRKLFKNVMTEISKDIETKDFVKPDSVVEVAVEKGSNPAMLPSNYTPDENIITELFVKGQEPGKTSEKFDELDPVSDLKAKYDEDSNKISVKWGYDSDEDVSFEVSASIDDGEMKQLSSSEEKSLDISEVEEGSEYTIQVIVVSEDGSGKSDAKTTKLKIPGDGDDDEEENIPGVDDLKANYDAGNNVIDVTWSYSGPPAHFEVDVNGQKQTADSNGMQITGISPGKTYTITVTPIGTDGSNDGVKGESRSIREEIPNDEVDPEEDSGESEENEGTEEADEEPEEESEEETEEEADESPPEEDEEANEESEE